jgi:hypothetical protein
MNTIESFEFETIKKCSEYWAENIKKLEKSKNEEISVLLDLVSFMADALESIVESNSICIRDIDDTDGSVEEKMKMIEKHMLPIIESSVAGDRLKDICRKIVMDIYVQSIQRT